MKAATGELQLTVITMIALAAIIGFFWMMWPVIKNSIGSQWTQINDKNQNSNYKSDGGNTPWAVEPYIITFEK